MTLSVPPARRILAVAALTVLLAACAHSGPRNPLATWVPSKNFDERRPVVIVLHYTEQDSVEQSLDTLRSRNSGGRVSSHYLLGKDGKIYQLVSDAKRAWHAGAGSWGAITDVNNASIGIEIDNDGKSPFPDAQIDSLIVLLRDLTTRLRIPPTQIIGHSDLAPTRKIDPGPLFPWKRLHDAGFGLWPADATQDPPAGFDPWLALQAIGYSTDNRADTVRAFHHRFRGMEGTELDAQDLRILHALTRTADTTPPAPASP
ncbi:N-acetylmuramoyl-L-alanine amidase [Pseudoxanthomonas mexicana]|jgi:N-acetylmuramoyl-L-alanine amidase|uniref:N-acetylmuramoyl-L-alanine amidase n=1 Tax=Pseudoxanthomonas mexicana TaxID=128785 RepID=UPI0022F3A9AB|nr:N-acetylmuramoyl-L-alanine amidase [Pseudoxanthomonas mexicana]WBX94706.1 N-acetylmuramoyl-L-alanine amidase [Pseudoxanthomonas mexicana]